MADKLSLTNIMLGGKGPSGSNRSKYLVQALKAMEGQGGPMYSPGEAIAKSLAAGITGRATLRAGEAEDARADAKKAQVEALVKSIYGDDKQALAAGMLNPEAAVNAFFKSREPINASEGTSIVVGGKPIYTAPKFGVTGDGRGYSATPNSMIGTGELAPTQVQRWGQENATADRDLKRTLEEAQQRIAQQNAQANMMGAQASQQNAGTNRAEYEARKAQGGFGTPGQGVAPWQMGWQ